MNDFDGVGGKNCGLFQRCVRMTSGRDHRKDLEIRESECVEKPFGQVGSDWVMGSMKKKSELRNSYHAPVLELISFRDNSHRIQSNPFYNNLVRDWKEQPGLGMGSKNIQAKSKEKPFQLQKHFQRRWKSNCRFLFFVQQYPFVSSYQVSIQLQIL